MYIYVFSWHFVTHFRLPPEYQILYYENQNIYVQFWISFLNTEWEEVVVLFEVIYLVNPVAVEVGGRAS